MKDIERLEKKIKASKISMLQCKQCGDVYFADPKLFQQCESCGGELVLKKT